MDGITKDKLIELLQEMDPTFSKASSYTDPACALLAACLLGTYSTQIRKVCDLGVIQFTAWRTRWSDSGIWTDAGIGFESTLDSESWIVEFWLDVMVGTGEVRRKWSGQPRAITVEEFKTAMLGLHK